MPVLKLQATDLAASMKQREVEERTRRIGQVSAIFFMEKRSVAQSTDKPTRQIVIAQVKNSSDQPIYDLRFRWSASGRGELSFPLTIRADPLMPGGEDFSQAPVPVGVAAESFGAVAIFRDRFDSWWRIRSSGKFDDLGRHEVPDPNW